MLLATASRASNSVSALSAHLREFKEALSDEVRAARRQGGDRIRMSQGRYIGPSQSKWLYEFRLDWEAWIPDDCGVEVEINKERYNATVVSLEGFDIILELEELLDSPPRRSTLIIKLWYILESLSARLDVAAAAPPRGRMDLLNLAGNPDGYHPTPGTLRELSGLNSAQARFVAHALASPVSFLWGPPGTGKTTTVGYLLHQADMLGMKSLVVATSNVAVDVAMLAAARRYENTPQQLAGRVFRFGTPRMDEVREHPWLGPDALLRIKAPHLALERDQLRGIIPKLKEQRESKALDKARERLREIRQVIDELNVKTASDARVLGCTLAKLAVHPFWADYQPDLVVLDEASMVSIPFGALAAVTARSKFVVAGDFRQLPPVVLAETAAANRWLDRHMFDHAGITTAVRGNAGDPRLVMLDTQYRMHEDISNTVSSLFYQGKLQTPQITREATSRVAARGPLSGKPIVLIDTSPLRPLCLPEPKDAGKSRFNLAHAVAALGGAKACVGAEHESVAIVTPFRAQSKLLRLLVDEAATTDHDMERIRVSTVHRFQGGEADAVVLDLATSPPHNKLGPLLGGDTWSPAGRLINVAMSRPRGKLIVLANRAHMDRVAGQHDAARLALAALLRGAHVVGMTSSALANGLGHDPASALAVERTRLWESSIGRVASEAAEISISVASAVGPPAWVVAAARRNTRIAVRGESLHQAWLSLPSSQYTARLSRFDASMVDRQMLWVGLDGVSTVRFSGRQLVSYLGELLNLTTDHDLAVPASSNSQEAQVLRVACIECGGHMWLDEGRYGPYLRCLNESCRKTRNLDPASASAILETIKVRCGKCGGLPVVKEGHRGLFVRCGKAGCDWRADIRAFL